MLGEVTTGWLVLGENGFGLVQWGVNYSVPQKQGDTKPGRAFSWLHAGIFVR
jgi:hypothetical protein